MGIYKLLWVFQLLRVEKKSHFVGIYFRESPGLQIIASITFRKYLKNVKYFCKILIGLGLKEQ